jgi:hypothetical protein
MCNTFSVVFLNQPKHREFDRWKNNIQQFTSIQSPLKNSFPLPFVLKYLEKAPNLGLIIIKSQLE